MIGHLYHQKCVEKSTVGARVVPRCPTCRVHLEAPFFANVWIQPLIDELSVGRNQVAATHRFKREADAAHSLEMQQAACKIDQLKAEITRWERKYALLNVTLETQEGRLKIYESRLKRYRKDRDKVKDWLRRGAMHHDPGSCRSRLGQLLSDMLRFVDDFEGKKYHHPLVEPMPEADSTRRLPTAKTSLA